VEMEETLEHAKDQALKLSKAESTILKYQQRLDEFAALKREHKGLKEKLEVYGALEERLEATMEECASVTEQLKEAQTEYRALQSEKSAFASLLMDKEEKLEEALALVDELRDRATHVVDEEEVPIEDIEIEGPPPSITASENTRAADTETLEALRQRLLQAEAELEESKERSSRAVEEKERLETFSRESMQAFKSKFTSTLKSLTEEKEMLEGALERLADRCEFDRETFKREERLLLGAIHGLGVEIMNMNVKKLVTRNHMTSTSGESTALSPTRSVLAETQSRQMQALDSLIE